MFLFILNLLVQELLIRKYQIVNKPEIIQFNGDFQGKYPFVYSTRKIRSK